MAENAEVVNQIFLTAQRKLANPDVAQLQWFDNPNWIPELAAVTKNEESEFGICQFFSDISTGKPSVMVELRWVDRPNRRGGFMKIRDGKLEEAKVEGNLSEDAMFKWRFGQHFYKPGYVHNEGHTSENLDLTRIHELLTATTLDKKATDSAIIGVTHDGRTRTSKRRTEFL